MAKTKIFATVAIVLIVLTQTCFAQQITGYGSVQINHTSHRVMLTDTKIWIEDTNWNKLKFQNQPIYLFLDETNPTFFALVYNTLKDHMVHDKSECFIWVRHVTSPTNGTHAKIEQLQIR